MKDPIRRTGRTTSQMQSAPKEAIYVWLGNNLDYPHRLAYALQRTDLKIISPTALRWETHAGLVKPVVVDHATKLHPDQRELVAILNKRCWNPALTAPVSFALSEDSQATVVLQADYKSGA